jgi:hypothetical protein
MIMLLFDAEHTIAAKESQLALPSIGATSAVANSRR